MPEPVSNDLGATYAADRSAALEQSAGAALLKEMGGDQAAGDKRQPSSDEIPPVTMPAKGGSRSIAPNGELSLYGGVPMSQNLAVKATKDIAYGVGVEAPRAIYTGVHDAIKNTYAMVDDFSRWAGEKISSATGVYGLRINETGAHVYGNKQDFDAAERPGELNLSAVQDAVRDEMATPSRVGPPSSVTGGLIKGVTQFVAGLAMTSRALGVLPKLQGAAGAGLSALKGAAASFAAFDPHQLRLSNLIERFPMLSNPVTQYLASKPDDSNAEGRFKNAIEGLGLGAVGSGLIKAVRLLRGAADAHAQLDAAATPAPAPGLDEGAFSQLGDVKQPLVADEIPPVTLPPQPEQGALDMAAEGGISPEDLTAATKQPVQNAKTFINFARIDAPEDIERSIQALADARAGNIEAAQRGAQTFEQIKLNAGQQNAWNILKSRRIGEPLNAEQSVAARQLWGASAAKVKEMGRIADDAPTEENLFAFRKMLSIHNAIQEQVLGARTETARSLASWRIPTGTPEGRLQDITERLAGLGGGAQTSRELARRVTMLASSTDENAALQLSKFAETASDAKTWPAVVQAFRDSLLSSPVTNAKILASNVSTALWKIAERKVGEGISSVLDTPDGIAHGEAAAQWSGTIGSFKDAMAYGWKALKSGTTGEGLGDPHEAWPSNLSAEALGLTADGEPTALGRVANFIDSALSLNRRVIVAQHDMAQTMSYGAEKNALAVRMATSEVNAGSLAEGDFDSRVADLLANPPDALTEAARNAAKYYSFLDEPGKWTQAFMKFRNAVPPLQVIMPFVKIVSRIQSYTFERSALAPLMSEFRSKIAAGGATRDLALAQVTLGALITSAAADMTLSGRSKGGGPPEKGLEQAQEREGSLRDSVKVGDAWYNVNGVHPIGKLWLLATDVAEAVTGGQHELHDDADTEKLVAGTSLAVGRTLLDNSYFQGMSNLFAMLHDARVGGSGETALLSTAGSVVPAAVATGARATDPYQREIYSMLDEFKSKIPGLSRTLPPRRDLWGEPISSGFGPITNLVSPVKVSPGSHSPIDDEILHQGFNIAMPGRNQSFKTPSGTDSIDLAKYPAAYSRLLELSGHALRSPVWGVGLKDLLNSIVTGSHPLSQVYALKSDGPEGGKETMVRDLIGQYRDLAKAQILDEFPAMRSEVESKAEAQRALKLGNLQ